MRSEHWPKGGFTLIEILIVIAIIGLLAALAIPNFLRTRTNAQTKACISNLRQIDAAKQLWGLENGKTAGDVATEADLTPKYLKAVPVCPAAGVYDYQPIGRSPTCTIPRHTL
jgi:prepilin-type N-terminal cleavage/methylation domain-containing protein